MPIERLIHGSIPCGINSEKNGYQVYTQTPGCAELESLFKSLTASYAPPSIDDYFIWFGEEKIKANTYSDEEIIPIANQASQIAREKQPATFSFSSVDINGEKRYCFVYAKDMGIDWAMGRPYATYSNIVVCDKNDVSVYPATLCSSSVVCCDILREDFFPNDGRKISVPEPLKYLKTLSDNNDVKLRHSAGFEEISIDEVFQFIQAEDRIEILKSMISALIMLKTGNESCRIIIADEKDNIIKWILAVTYVFPLESALDISFSTYSYKFDNSFDITGAYIPELNGRSLTEGMENIDVTEYNYEGLQNSNAVYDFKKQAFATNIEVYDNLFISMVENAFSINKQIIDGYKKYILTSTTYRKIDSSYMDGAILYMFLEKNKRLTPKQMQLALTFAQSYATNKEKKRIFDHIMSAYKDYTSDSEMLDVIVEFIRYCVDQGVTEQRNVESIFMNDAKTAFLDYTNYSFDSFSVQGTITERLCGFKPGQMEIALVTTIGLKTLCDIIDDFQKFREVQRISYIHTALCHYVKANKGTFKTGSYEEKIATKIINVFVVGESLDNENRLNTLLEKTCQIVEDCVSQFDYSDIAYRTVSCKGYKQISENIGERIAKSYLSMSTDQRTRYINVICTVRDSKVYLKLILAAIYSEYEPSKRLAVLSEAITNNRNAFAEFVTPIKRMALNIGEYTVDSSFYYKAYYLFKVCDKTYGVNVSKDEIELLLSNYVELLYSEHRDFILDENTSKALQALNREFVAIRADGASYTLVNAFLLISEMSKSVDSKVQNVFNGYSKIPALNFSNMRNTEQSSIIESVGKLSAQYWLNTERMPIIDKWFAFESATQQQKTYAYLLGEILDAVLKSKSRNRYDIAAQVIELGIFYRLTTFLGDLPDILVNTVKQSDILKPLEKDIESKTRLKAQKGILAQIDVIELQEVVHSIEAAYEEKAQNSTFGKVKRAFGSIFGGSKKDKKDE